MAEQQPGQVEQSSVRAPIFTFRDQVKDFARPNLFQVEIYAPPILSDGVSPSVGGVSGSQADANEVAAGGSNLDASSASAFGTFLVKAANIPSSVVGVVDVPYRGRMLKIAGDRTFEPWTVTVLNDQSFKFRAFFEAWSSNIQALQQNYQNANTIADYQAMAKVRQMDRKGSIIRTYKFEGIWPSNISAIELDWGNNDTPEEYTVEFQVQYWTYDNDINTGNNSGSSQL
jgi:hypothetical protein|tara:strand:+ start:487 stop:1173 length:687 start_codon:yes stop_codon:yes gene_type:complete